MKSVLFFSTVASLLLWSCATHKSTVRPPSADESLAFIDEVAERQNEESPEWFEDDDPLLPRLEEFCDRGIQLPVYSSVESLRGDIDAALALDSTLIVAPLESQRFIGFIAGSEFLYRFLNTAQARLEAYYQGEQQRRYPESYTSTDGEFVFHFEQNVSEMLPVTQSNSAYSAKRTFYLNQLVEAYPQLTTEAEKQRFWLAIQRMLEPLDLSRSETGYAMFQRGADGLADKPSRVLARLSEHQEQERNESIRQTAELILQQAHQNLQSPLSREDKVLISTVELNRKFFQEIQADSAETTEAEDISLWFSRGFETDDPQLKIEYYSRVLSLDSTHAAAFNNRGNAHQAVGQYDVAKRDFDRALTLNPEFHLAYKNRGSLLLVQQKYNVAIADLTRAIELDPVCSLCFADRGKAYLNLGRYSEALQDFDRAVQLDPAEPYGWNYRGMCLQKLNREAEALENFNRALQLDPNFVQAYIYRGNVHRQMKNDQNAISDYTAALALDPDNFIALNSRAISYRNLQHYDKAIADHQQSLEIRPKDAMIYYNLGCVYWEQRDWPAVVHSWERALDLEPEHRLAKEWLPMAQEQLRQRR